MQMKTGNRSDRLQEISNEGRNMSPTQMYVIIVHTPTGRAWALSRNYVMMSELLTKPYKDYLSKSKTLDQWDGWLPTSFAQVPEWARSTPAEEFYAYWIEGPQSL